MNFSFIGVFKVIFYFVELFSTYVPPFNNIHKNMNFHEYLQSNNSLNNRISSSIETVKQEKRMHKCSKKEKKGGKQQKRRVFESEQSTGQGRREARRKVAKREKETGRQTKHTGIHGGR